MIDVTFVIDGVDCSPYLSNYTVSHSIEQRETITTMDGTEYTATHIRPVINLDSPDNRLRYTIGDEMFDYITFREFRGDVNDYRDR